MKTLEEILKKFEEKYDTRYVWLKLFGDGSGSIREYDYDTGSDGIFYFDKVSELVDFLF